MYGFLLPRRALCDGGCGWQVFLEFESAFWERKVPVDTGQFGITLGEAPHERGMASVVWNFKPFNAAPVLCSLLTGSSAIAMESLSDAEVAERALEALRAVFGRERVPRVVASCCARWGEDEFARGSYSYVAVGGSGDSYDLMARPLGRSLLFCGEHTSKEHLDTVGGAMRSGVREVRCRPAQFARRAELSSSPCIQVQRCLRALLHDPTAACKPAYAPVGTGTRPSPCALPDIV